MLTGFFFLKYVYVKSCYFFYLFSAEEMQFLNSAYHQKRSVGTAQGYLWVAEIRWFVIFAYQHVIVLYLHTLLLQLQKKVNF